MSTITSAPTDVRAGDGLVIALRAIEGAGSGGTVWLSHATGFCGACWNPVIDGLRPAMSKLVVWDHRGHGRSRGAAIPASWWEMGSDVATVVGSQMDAPRPWVAVGHSMGGAAVVMAELTTPGTFDGMVLVEPILLAPPVRRTHYAISDMVLKRRMQFASRERALLNFSRKLPFSRWDRSALEGYVTDGLVENGEGVELACPPEFEAEVYRGASAHGTFAFLDQVQPPTVVTVGGESDTYDVPWATRIAGRLRQGELEVIPDGSHFIPMEQPHVVVDQVIAMQSRVTTPESRVGS